MGKSAFLPKIETQSPAEIRKFQEIQLVQELEYLNEYSPFYSQLFEKNKIDISKIRTLEDLSQLPFTTKDDLQKHNQDFLCVPQEDIIDYITTSGTAGHPVTFAATDNDLERLAYNEAISFTCAHATSQDTFQIMTTIDRRFMAGLAYFLGLRKMGAALVRVGSGMPDLQWESILRFKPTYLIAVPSFILKLIEFAESNGIDLNNTSVKNAVCIGEPLRNADFTLNTLGKRITSKWKLKLFSTYASTEMGASFTECEFGRGGHHHPELIITEFLDENDRPVKEGEAGELTVTTLGVEGMPLLRFKTGDICHHYTEPCRCGRNTMRLGPIIGRKQQMIKYKGTTLYPPALFELLDNFESIANYVIRVSTNEIHTDNISIFIGAKSKENDLLNVVKERFRAKLRVVPEIIFMTPDEIHKMQFPGSNRKAIKFIDERKQ